MLLDALGEHALGESVKRVLLLAANTGLYTLTGNAVSALRQAKIAANSGAYLLAGENAGIVAPTRSAAIHRAFLLGEGPLAATAVAQGPEFRSVSAATGSYTLTGKASVLTATRKLLLGTGAYVLAGEPVTLIHATGFIPPSPPKLFGLKTTTNVQGIA